MTKTTKWGLLGLGKIATKFATALTLTPHAEIYAVASRSQDKANNFAQKMNAAKAYGSYEALLDDSDVTVVYIATPHTYHTKWSIKAMEKGKAVLCEKPMAMNQKDAQRMIDCAKANQVFLMEALWTRFIPAYRKTKKLIKEGAIGDIKYLYADFGFSTSYKPRLFEKHLGGGSLLDVGIYPVFLAANLLGKPKSIQASAILSEKGVDETCSMLFDYGDKTAVLSSSMVIDQATEAVICGTKGRIKIPRRWHEPETVLVINKDTLINQFDFEEKGNKLEYEAMEVQRCLNAGKLESDMMSWADSLLLHGLLDAVRKKIGLVYEAFD